jgi:hypothetical protein
MQKVLRLSRTVTRFKSAQLGEKFNYQIKKFFLANKILGKAKANVEHAFPVEFIPSYATACGITGKKFTLHNRSKEFKEQINWNFQGFGVLWNTMLNSFEFLCNEHISEAEGVSAIHAFINSAKDNVSFFDSHCITGRIINAVKFCSRYKIRDQAINEFIYYQCIYLKKNPEFHLRNHHLLENGFALLFASLYFNDYSFFDFAERLLYNNLPKQILPDGAHFELSPMYHLLILHHILDSIYVLKKSNFTSERLNTRLEQFAPKMLGWIRNLQMTNGCLPAFNDSADGYCPPLRTILKMATDLKIQSSIAPLKESGFRKLKNRNFEMVVDVNGLSPQESPGHSHADTFHFVLYVFGDPFIIDTGVSTYTKGKDRLYERSTMAHNTVVIDNLNQSEIYNAFRVGRRAKVTKLQEKNNEIVGTHDGYSHRGVWHTRKISFKNDYVEITDTINSKKKVNCQAFLHIDKKSGLYRQGDKFISRFTTIEFSNHSTISLNNGWHTPSFGQRSPCYVICTGFHNEIITRIRLNREV